jgi:hypothetical protein
MSCFGTVPATMYPIRLIARHWPNGPRHRGAGRQHVVFGLRCPFSLNHVASDKLRLSEAIFLLISGIVLIGGAQQPSTVPATTTLDRPGKVGRSRRTEVQKHFGATRLRLSPAHGRRDRTAEPADAMTAAYRRSRERASGSAHCRMRAPAPVTTRRRTSLGMAQP